VASNIWQALLDGCTGMASFIKTCLVAQHAAAPPIVHFKVGSCKFKQGLKALGSNA
jgi:acyl transferase domain-containing protein